MRTQKQIEANYTELVHAGEGITIDKGKISTTGGEINIINMIDDHSFSGSDIKPDSFNVLKYEIAEGVAVFFPEVAISEPDGQLRVLLTAGDDIGIQLFYDDGTGTYIMSD